MEYMKKPAYRLVAFVALTVTISFISLKVFSGPDSVSKHLLSWTKPTAESSRGAYIYDSPKTIITRFQAIPDLEDLSGAGDHVWSTKLLTPHGGFLRVQYNDTFEQNWGISMFHGLHCLQLIRSNLVQANARLSDQAMAATHASHDHHGAHEQGGGIGTTGTNDHLGHCFAYIAQSLICASDGTIEPPWEDRDEQDDIIQSGVDGENYQHQCKDASLLWDTAEQSEQKAWAPWDWKMGDTVQSVFGAIEPKSHG